MFVKKNLQSKIFCTEDNEDDDEDDLVKDGDYGDHLKVAILRLHQICLVLRSPFKNCRHRKTLQPLMMMPTVTTMMTIAKRRTMAGSLINAYSMTALLPSFQCSVSDEEIWEVLLGKSFFSENFAVSAHGGDDDLIDDDDDDHANDAVKQDYLRRQAVASI